MNQAQLQFESIDPGSLAIVWAGVSLLGIAAAMLLARFAFAPC
jgi:hypothetical protein